MIESIFVKQSIQTRHYRAPLLREREEYLRYLLGGGKNRETLQNVATVLLHVIRILEITTLQKRGGE
jgi:integrase/recombinase XerD